MSDTIIAPITGRGAVTLFRISGSRAAEFLYGAVTRGASCVEQPRQAILSPLIDVRSGESFDEALVTYFMAPNSYTGEDTVELSIHGSAILAKQLIEVTAALGIRLAEAGEFTKRAYLNGKLDLTQAEAILDLISSETVEQARVAREQLAGRLAGAIAKLGEPLRDFLSEVEARIDFPEEGIEPAIVAQWISGLESALTELARYISSYQTGKVLHDGAQVAIIGAPNAGKSSLLNRMVGENRAIVTDIPGTTRDEIEERIAVQGIPVRLWDTAGIVAENSRVLDPVEVLGIKRSRDRIQYADLVILLFDGTQGFAPAVALLEDVRQSARPYLVAANKADALAAPQQVELQKELISRGESEIVFVSALTGDGVSALRESIGARLLAGLSRAPGALLVTSERHVQALKKAEQALQRARSCLAESAELLELVATEVQHALGALDDIVGVTTSEDILGRIFSKFCIGK